MIVKTLPEFAPLIPEMGRLLGLDVGTKTIGIALSDRTRMIASPLVILPKGKVAEDVAALSKLITEHRIVGLVIGFPLNMNGTEGPRCDSIKDFAKNMDAHLNIPMCFWDERLSTSAATRTMIEADLSRKRQKEVIDKMAASIILQGFMDGLSRVRRESGI